MDLEVWEHLNGGLYYQDLPYALEMIRAKLINRHHIDILVGGWNSKRPVDWPRILLIRVTIESPQRSTKCLFLPTEKAAAMVSFSSTRSTHKDSILQFKAVKVTIDTSSFAEAIVNVIISLQVVTNSGALYPLKTCHCCTIF